MSGSHKGAPSTADFTPRPAKTLARILHADAPYCSAKRLCDVYDDELNRTAQEVGSRKKAFQPVKADHKLGRF